MFAMIILYILLIVLGAVPLALTIWRLREQKAITKHGIHTTAVITNKKIRRLYKAPPMDELTLCYKNIITDQVYYNTSYAKPGRFKVGDKIPVTYMPGKQHKIVWKGGATHWPMLWFGIVLFLFVLYAVYKLNEMVTQGNY